MIDRMNMRGLGLASVVAALIGLSPALGQAANAAAQPDAVKAGAATVQKERDMAPKAPARDVFRSLRDWTGMIRMPGGAADASGDTVHVRNGASGLPEWLLSPTDGTVSSQKSALTGKHVD